MKLVNAIEGGLAGAGTLSLLQEALHKVDHSSPRPLLHQAGLLKKLKKNSGKPGMKSTKLYIQLASELVSNAALFGLSGLGKKRNALLRGTLLGAAAGLGSAFLQKEDKEKNGDGNFAGGENGIIQAQPVNADMKKKIMTVTLYAAGGLLAGLAVKNVSGKKVKKGMKKFKKKMKW
jgi:hypothetical protein